MRNLVIVLSYLYAMNGNVFAAVSKGINHSVYKEPNDRNIVSGVAYAEGNNFNKSDEKIDIFIGSVGGSDADKNAGTITKALTNGEGLIWNNEKGFIDDGNVTGELLRFHYRKCLITGRTVDCIKFKLLKFIKNLLEPKAFDNFREAMKSVKGENEPLLVRLPPPYGKTQPVVSQTVRKLFSRSGSMQIVDFLLEVLDDFVSKYGVIITVKNPPKYQPDPLDYPWLIAYGRNRVGRSTRKVKKKAMSIIFPMLVLFKFLKIKALLVTILLGVIFLKKVFIFTLTLLPYAIGFLGCGRRGQYLGGFTQAGILQEVDTRGEFSNNVAYAIPYRTREKMLATDAYRDY